MLACEEALLRVGIEERWLLLLSLIPTPPPPRELARRLKKCWGLKYLTAFY